MDQSNQPTGNFKAFANRKKQPGDKLPAFVNGELTVPGTEETHTFELTAHEYVANRETGEVATMYRGRLHGVPTTGGVSKLSNLDLDPGDVVLFPNKFKGEAPDKNRPTHWGAANPGAGKPVIRISGWLGQDRYERPVFLGSTSYPIPGKSEAQMQAAAAAEPQKGRRRSKAEDKGDRE